MRLTQNLTPLAVLGALTAFQAQGSEMTLERFEELRGGDPDLTWIMLDCVQGAFPSEQIAACDTAVKRYHEVIAAGEELLSVGTLDPKQTEDVQTTLQQSRTTLPIMHMARANLLAVIHPAQAEWHCAQAYELATEFGDATLLATTWQCPVNREAPSFLEDYGNLNIAEIEARTWMDGAGRPLLYAIVDNDPDATQGLFEQAIEAGDLFARALWGTLLHNAGAVEAGAEHIMAAAKSGNPFGRTIAEDIACETGNSLETRQSAAEELRAVAREGFSKAAELLAFCEDPDGTATGNARNPIWLTVAATITGEPKLGSSTGFWQLFFDGMEARNALDMKKRSSFKASGNIAKQEFKALLARAYADELPDHELWAGAYICGQGITGGLMSIDGSLSGERRDRDAMLYFFPTPMNPGVPQGCIRGTIRDLDEPGAAWDFQWVPEEWIKEVEGFNLTQGSVGRLEFGDLVSYVEIDHPLCSEGIFQRVILPPLVIPAYCRLD